MAPILSNGAVNQMAANNSLKDALGPFELRIFGISGTTVPTTADAAEVGQLLLRLTRTGNTTKAAQVTTVTPTVTTTTSCTWQITINGHTVTYVSDATTTAKEICDNMVILLNTLNGGNVAAVTPGTGSVDIAKADGLFTVSDDDAVITITAATAGVPLQISSTCTGTDNTFVTAITTADGYGLQFEEYADVATGILELKSGHVPTGTAIATGTAVYGRICHIDDAGTLSTTAVRIQGTVGVSNADITLTHTDITLGEPSTASVGTITLSKS